MAPLAMIYDQAANLTANEFSKTGYIFAGWSTTATGSVEYLNQANVTNLAESGTVTLYAVWTAIPYTIALNLNGGTLPTGYTETTTVTIEDFPYVLPMPTKDAGGGASYEFLGWYDTNDTTGTKHSILSAPANYTLYAIWSTDTVFYQALYPQTKVTDPNLINVLNGITSEESSVTIATSQGTEHTEKWYTVTYQGTKFEKVGSNYFKYEPIAFLKLATVNSYYSKYILDYSPFDQYQKNVATNIYANSYVKKYLEQVFNAKAGLPNINILSRPLLELTANFANNDARKATSTDYGAVACVGERGKITSFSTNYQTSYMDRYWTSTHLPSQKKSAQFVRQDGSISYHSVNQVFGIRILVNG